MFLPEDSPVSLTVLQENGKAKRMNATCGPKCLEQLEKFNHVGSLAKTFLACLIGNGEWYSTKSKLTWKLRGLKSSHHLYCQLVAKTLPIGEIDFGLWPTPDTIQRGRPEIAIQMRDANLPLYTRRDKAGTGRQFSILDFAIYHRLLPTPRANESTESLETINRRREKTGMGMMNLTAILLATPNSRDEKGEGGNGKDLNRDLGIRGRQLNPQFVLEMMGFPVNWTELPFLSGETNQSKQEETQ